MVGSVCINYNSKVSSLRSLIYKELELLDRFIESFIFIDNNGWPVRRENEDRLTVLEVLAESCITLSPDIVYVDNHLTATGTDYNKNSILSSDTPPRKKVRRMKELTFCTSKDDLYRTSCSREDSLSLPSKQLLISYVRAEAAQHALDLKQQLSSLGFSVYLDVHEIKSGVDWQDSLNYAVSNCQIFIPLITPRYGETQWTNREVKLADVLGKFILPVNFLDTWPPRCLAIQFATTQYIQWKTPQQFEEDKAEYGEERAKDISYWDNKYISHVAQSISDRLTREDIDIERLPSLTRRKTLMKTFAGKLPNGLLDEVSEDSNETTDSPNIVICVHPSQKHISLKVKGWLLNHGFNVWCSNEKDVDMTDEDHIPSSFDCSRESENGYEPVDKDYIKYFQQKADEASVVIILLSSEFTTSRTCQQQVFYCEHRKPVIPLQYKDVCIPGWLSMLIGSTSFHTIEEDGYEELLLSQINRNLQSCGKDNLQLEINEAKINTAVKCIKKSINNPYCVYISGSTKFYNQNTENICRAIGKRLATRDNIAVVTGGFYGVGETLSKAFYEENQRLWKKNKVWHILPEKDPQDRRQKAKQRIDGTFEKASFGKSLFCGEMVRERESIVAKTFDICILLEGGPGAAHEVEEFVWNDRIVIPIVCTGGAASGKFNVPEKIFQIPQGVAQSDWNILSNKDVSPDNIGQAVYNIVDVLFKNITSETSNIEMSSTSAINTPNISPTSSQLSSTTPPLSSMSTLIL